MCFVILVLYYFSHFQCSLMQLMPESSLECFYFNSWYLRKKEAAYKLICSYDYLRNWEMAKYFQNSPVHLRH